MSVRQIDRNIAHSTASRARKLLSSLAVVVILGVGIYTAADFTARSGDVVRTATAAQTVEPVLAASATSESATAPSPVSTPLPASAPLPERDVNLLAQPTMLFDEMLADVEALVRPIPNSMIASLKAETTERQEAELVEANPS